MINLITHVNFYYKVLLRFIYPNLKRQPYRSLKKDLFSILSDSDDYNVIQVGEHQNTKEFRARSVVLLMLFRLLGSQYDHVK